jgi:hypothetical protein
LPDRDRPVTANSAAEYFSNARERERRHKAPIGVVVPWPWHASASAPSFFRG